jgi:hypothetical protein
MLIKLFFKNLIEIFIFLVIVGIIVTPIVGLIIFCMESLGWQYAILVGFFSFTILGTFYDYLTNGV